MANANELAQKHNNDIFDRVRPVASVVFDWLTIEPIWRSYRRFGSKSAVAVGFGLFFAWSFILTMPATIIGALLTIPGIIAEDALVDVVMQPVGIVAFGLTAYGGYRAWSLVDDRRTLYERAQNPNIDRVIDSFEYLNRDDTVSRVLAARLITAGADEKPREVVSKSDMAPDQLIFEIADLLHDDSVEVRRSGSETLVYLSENYPEEIAKYRDDVYSGITYPDTVVQSNCLLIAGNLAYYEPALEDEAVQYVAMPVEDPDPEVRVRVAAALGMIHNQRSKEVLNQLLNDQEQAVQEQARRSLRAHENDEQPDVTNQTDDWSSFVEK